MREGEYKRSTGVRQEAMEKRPHVMVVKRTLHSITAVDAVDIDSNSGKDG